MVTWELRRIPLWPVTKVSFIVFFALGLVLSLLYSAFALTILQAISGLMGDFSSMPVPTGLPLIMVSIFASFLMAIMYTVIMVITALFYNATTSYLGGIQLELEQVSSTIPAPAAKAPEVAATTEPATRAKTDYPKAERYDDADEGKPLRRDDSPKGP
ncbi:DUF3566 domain-containing protein [bacterium]|nr:DUF3566 domain-containing protein [bacterium]